MEVGTSDARLVGQVQNKRHTTKLKKNSCVSRGTLHMVGRRARTYESRVGRRGRRVQVDVAGGECVAFKGSVLAAQVARLANLGLAGIALFVLAVVVRVQVSASTRAVAVGRNGLSMDVVHERAASSRETRKVNVEAHALAAVGRRALNGASEAAAVLGRQCGNVLGTSRVVGGDGCVASLGGDGRGRGQEGDEGDEHLVGVLLLDCYCW